MELWVGAINLGFLYAFLTIGMYLTSRVQNFPDITVDGTFATGAAVTAILLTSGWHPLLALIPAFFAGAVAGMCTGLIHTKLGTNGLLSGIIVMIGLYSINLHIMGRSNIPLLTTPNIFAMLEELNPVMNRDLWLCVSLAVILAAVWAVITLFLRTDFGIMLRATGDNEAMATASGIGVDTAKTFSIAFANGLVGLSGGLVAQYQGFADIGMGIGTVVIGLAAVIVGESVFRDNAPWTRVMTKLLGPIGLRVFSAVFGSLLFRLMIALALYAGMNPVDLKLLTALFVLATLVSAKTRLAGLAKLFQRTRRVQA
jgi:putative ABC transport system permease protein